MDYEHRFQLPSKEKQHSLTGLIILDKMIKKDREFSTMLEGDDTHLEPVFDFLCGNNVFEVDVDKACYYPTAKGKELYRTFLQRYEEYLRIYDIFCAVDLEQGCFAFEKIFDYNDDIFANYVNDNRFADLRVTVLEFKNQQKETIDPLEVIFISFLIEKRFREPRDRQETLGSDSWQYKCCYGDIFSEIVEICNASLHFDELGYETVEGEFVSGEEVICDIIEQGVALARGIRQRQADLEAEERQRQQEEAREMNQPEVETYTTYESFDSGYYDPYYDPYYVSPIWDLALLAIIL